jgi:hypothetical protein
MPDYSRDAIVDYMQIYFKVRNAVRGVGMDNPQLNEKEKGLGVISMAVMYDTGFLENLVREAEMIPQELRDEHFNSAVALLSFALVEKRRI